MTGTVIDPTGRYRYRLERQLEASPDLFAAPGPRRPVVFIMLNPSTADASNNDPTLTRCMGYATAWGAAELVVVNLYAYRTPDPLEVDAQRAAGTDVVGPDNDEHLEAAARLALDQDGTIVAGWGAHKPGTPDGRAAHAARIGQVRALLDDVGAPLHALELAKGGEPRHPLYLPASLEPQRWPPLEVPWHEHADLLAEFPRPKSQGPGCGHHAHDGIPRHYHYAGGDRIDWRDLEGDHTVRRPA